MEDPFDLGGETFSSRLILGTGGASSLDALEKALRASGAEMATVALRRVSPEARGSVLEVLERVGVRLLPNTAGCFTAHDAITTARLAREAFETDWIKLEVIGDDRTKHREFGRRRCRQQCASQIRRSLRRCEPDRSRR